MAKPIPDNYPQVMPYLIVDGASEAIEFYKGVLGATERMRLGGPDGRVGHAELEIGEAVIMLADENPGMSIEGPKSVGGTPVTIHVYIEDADAAFERAVQAGAKPLRAVEDQFYGDRSGQFEDPYGHRWNVATHVEDISEEEMSRRAAEIGEGLSEWSSRQVNPTGSPRISQGSIRRPCPWSSASWSSCAAGISMRRVALLAVDVVYENVGLPTVHGRERVRRLFGRAYGSGGGFDVVIHTICADGPSVLTERTDFLTFRKLHMEFWVCGRFDVRDGQIVLVARLLRLPQVQYGSLAGVAGSGSAQAARQASCEGLTCGGGASRALSVESKSTTGSGAVW